METKEFKDFELILPSFKCNRDCPYCTAKITKWQERELDLNTFEKTLNELEIKGYHFKYFILCGNGEPSLYSLEDINTIFDSVNKHRSLFEHIRVQTSGNLFFEKDKINSLPQDTIIEITRVHKDFDSDKEVLKYNRDYLDTETFKEWKNIRLNMVVLNNATAESLIKQAEYYSDTFKNIKTISIKTLNLNTKGGSTDNKYSQWILKNAVSRKECMSIVQEMQQLLGQAVVEYKDRYVWKLNDTEITLYSAKGKTYGDTHMVYYGNEIVDFNLNKIEI